MRRDTVSTETRDATRALCRTLNQRLRARTWESVRDGLARRRDVQRIHRDQVGNDIVDYYDVDGLVICYDHPTDTVYPAHDCSAIPEEVYNVLCPPRRDD